MTTDDLPSLAGRGAISIDTETHDPDLSHGASGVWAGRTQLAGVSISTEDGSVRQYYPVGHSEGPNLDKRKVIAWLKRELRTNVPKVGANLLYDAQVLEREGVKLGGPLYDVQVAEPLLVEDRFSYSLDAIAKSYCDRGKKTEQLKEYLIERFGRKNAMAHIAKAPADLVAPYAIEDANLPMEIFAKQKEELKKQNLWGLFELESKLIPMLVAMRKRGIRVDIAATEQMRSRMKSQYDAIIREVKRLTGVEVQPWAADSFKKIFDDEQIPYPLTPKTKKPSFTATFLENCDHPVAKMIVEARKLDKMIGTFLEGSILERHHDGVIHCNFNQLKGEGGGAVSGRFSCVAPWTPIATRRGTIRIDQVRIGDEVFTHRRRWRRVTATWVKGFERMFDVYLTNGWVLTCTGKHRVYIESLGHEQSQPGEGPRALPDNVSKRDRRSARDDSAQCFRRVEDLLDDERTSSYVLVEPLTVKDGTEESHERKAVRGAPQLEGCNQRQERLPDDRDSRRTHPLPSVRSEEHQRLRDTPHRRQPDEQQSRQLSCRDLERPCDDPRSPEERSCVVKIKEIKASCYHPVYDITVEEDESYLACGMFSHNSSAPNLQFIPVRTENGKLLRQIFLPDPGQDFYHLDYSQIEYRLLVHDAAYLKLRGAEAVAKQFREDPDVDFHQVVADMTGLPRASAKTINFGIAYGEGKEKLSRSLGLTISEAEKLLRDYHAKAPFMQPLSQGFMGEASRTGIIKTLLGRVRRFNSWERYDPVEKKSVVTRHRMPGARRAFTHKALNARTQGSAADVMKKAMVDVWESGACDVLGPPQLTVHDELDGSCPKSRAGREALREMKRVMERTISLIVPLKVDADVGKNWGDLTKMDDSEPAADGRRTIR